MTYIAGAPLSDQADRMVAWTDKVARGNTLLYTRLGEATSRDAELLTLLSKLPQQQPVPLLLFGAVHQLLLNGAEHPLREFYATCTDTPDPISDPFPAFKEFVMDHYDTIIETARTRQVQTNEVARSSLFLPAYRIIARRTNRPLWIIEVGSSAGLTLLFDQWHYTYHHGHSSIEVGNHESPVRLECIVRGPQRPLFPDPMPEIAARIGVDLDPIDINNPDDESWIRGLVWPDRTDRHQRLSAAIAVARSNPVTLVAGDAIDSLEAQVAAASEDSVVVINHSHLLNQLQPERREDFVAEMDRLSEDRPIWRVSNEWLTHSNTRLDLIRHFAHKHQVEGLADVHHHGEWISWRGPTR
ncbi:MAG: DUF2332 domain-containing protein [Actinobacteria bacterium]|nr:DUF2332 domain-containing protein [Actinomycetota bacterium]